MTHLAKHFLVGTMLATVGLAQAAPVVLPADGSPESMGLMGQSTWAFSADLLFTLDTAQASLSSYGGASVSAPKDSDGYFMGAAVSSMISTITVDDVSGAILGYATTGGVTMDVPQLRSISSGGSITLTDMRYDLPELAVYATLIGANGVGTVNQLHLFDISSITGAPSTVEFDSRCGINNDCSYLAPHVVLQGLTFTAEGRDAVSRALGFPSDGLAHLALLTDEGVVFTGAVPEPQTYLLMGLGLVGMALVHRRRQPSLSVSRP